MNKIRLPRNGGSIHQSHSCSHLTCDSEGAWPHTQLHEAFLCCSLVGSVSQWRNPVLLHATAPSCPGLHGFLPAFPYKHSTVAWAKPFLIARRGREGKKKISCHVKTLTCRHAVNSRGSGFKPFAAHPLWQQRLLQVQLVYGGTTAEHITKPRYQT